MNSKIFNVDCITSKSNSTIVKIAKLSNKKERIEQGLFTLDGVKLFLEAYNFGAKIKYIILDEKTVFEEEIIEKIKLLQKNCVNVLCVNEAVFQKLTGEKAPQGIITVSSFLDLHSFISVGENSNNGKIIIFESIRDPGNIGSILRNAAAFGIDKLIFSSDCADIYSSKVIRASMGAIFKVKIEIVDDLLSTIVQLRKNGRRVISTTLGENSLMLGKSEISSKDVFVIGNEGHGVSKEIIEASCETMFIPMCSNTESLNASVAGAILMWELFKL